MYYYMDECGIPLFEHAVCAMTLLRDFSSQTLLFSPFGCIYQPTFPCPTLSAHTEHLRYKVLIQTEKQQQQQQQQIIT